MTPEIEAVQILSRIAALIKDEEVERQIRDSVQIAGFIARNFGKRSTINYEIGECLYSVFKTNSARPVFGDDRDYRFGARVLFMNEHNSSELIALLIAIEAELKKDAAR